MEQQAQPPQVGLGDPGHHSNPEPGPPEPKKFEIIVNMVPHRIEDDIVTFDEIVKLAGNLPSGPNVEYKITFERAVKPPHGTMIPGEKVQIKNGTEFVVTTTNRS